MQEVRWKEPEIIGEIELRRAMTELPMRAKKERRKAILLAGVYALLALGLLFSRPYGAEVHIRWSDVYIVVFLVLCLFPSAPKIQIMRASYRIGKLGVTEFRLKIRNFAWKDIENYRFETDERAPNLRVLVVEARKRKAPLRLYYEGENLEARLRDAITQGPVKLQQD